MVIRTNSPDLDDEIKIWMIQYSSNSAKSSV